MLKETLFFFFHFFVVVAVIIVVGCFLFSVFVYFCQGLFKLSNLFCVRVFHCLALACVDTAKDVAYIGTVEDLLRQLWKYLENSLKRMAIYLKVQQEVKSFDLSKTSRKVITKKLKKACHTRWLSLDHTVEAIFDDFEALMRT